MAECLQVVYKLQITTEIAESLANPFTAKPQPKSPICESNQIEASLSEASQIEANQSEPKQSEAKQTESEPNRMKPNRTEPTMDDLPELPFEQLLSYLSLEDRLKARAVSRSWRKKFDSYPVKNLCYSQKAIGHVLGKARLISGAFAKNFISSTRFDSFFNTFTRSILSSNLKHLRLCDLRLDAKNRTAFARILESFAQLEELDLLGIDPSDPSIEVLKLNLPTLKIIHIECSFGAPKITLKAPRLQKVKVSPRYSSIFWTLDIVHGESVELLIIGDMRRITMKKLKNLKSLYTRQGPFTDPRLLSNLPCLKEIHIADDFFLSTLFEQIQRYGRSDLKLYLRGLRLNGPDDPAIGPYHPSSGENVGHLAEHSASRLADEMPLYYTLDYTEIERVAPELAMNILTRYTDLNEVIVGSGRIQDTQRFLDFLKQFGNIVCLWFSGDEPQGLFDRLPEHCAVQSLTIGKKPADLNFLLRLKHLIRLNLFRVKLRIEFIRKVLEEFEFLSEFNFYYNNKELLKGLGSWQSEERRIIQNHRDFVVRIFYPKRFEISVVGFKMTRVSDLNDAIQFVNNPFI